MKQTPWRIVLERKRVDEEVSSVGEKSIYSSGKKRESGNVLLEKDG